MPGLREIENREHAAAALTELAEAGTLRLTDILQLPSRQRELCGFVILGQREQKIASPRGSFTNAIEAWLPLPPALAGYQVELEAINAWLDPERDDAGHLAWTDGSAARGHVQSRGQGALGLDGNERVELISGKVCKAKLDDRNRAKLDVRSAWLLLKRAGEHVVPAGNKAAQKALWRVREVSPEAPAPSRKRAS